MDQAESQVMPLFSRWFTGHRVLHRSVGFVPPGEPPQSWHVDSDGDGHYWTVIIPLTTENKAGGTEFKGGTIHRSKRGLAYAFHGGVVHRGTAHRGTKMRVFVALVVVPNQWDGCDYNVFSKPS